MPDDELVPRWLLGERRSPTVEAMMGAIGGLVALFGVTILYGEVPDDNARAGGLALALLTLLVGVVMPAVHPSRALAAAGVALSAGTVLPLAFLVANDPETLDSRADFLVAAFLAVLAWLVLFAVGPARGHGAFLGLALFGLWLGALSQTSPEQFFFSFRAMGSESVERVPAVPYVPPDDRFDPPTFEDMPPPSFDTIPPPSFDTIPPPSFQPPPTFRSPRPPPGFRMPTTTTTTTAAAGESMGRATLISAQFEDDDFEEPKPPVAPGVVSLLFGAAYAVVGAALDRRRLRRMASVFLLAGITALAFGVVMSGPRLGGTAVGVLGVMAALAVTAIGVTGGRRFVAWLGAAAGALSLATAVGSLFDDSAAGAAISMLVIGAAVVGLGVATAEREEPDLAREPGPEREREPAV